MLKVLKPDVFWPRPEVDSAIVSFVRDEAKVGRIKDMGLFCEIVRFFMSHRRKMLKSCFRFAAGRLCEIDNWAGIFESCRIEATQRPEQVEPAGYVAIANEVFLRTAIN